MASFCVYVYCWNSIVFHCIVTLYAPKRSLRRRQWRRSASAYPPVYSNLPDSSAKEGGRIKSISVPIVSLFYKCFIVLCVRVSVLLAFVSLLVYGWRGGTGHRKAISSRWLRAKTNGRRIHLASRSHTMSVKYWNMTTTKQPSSLHM